MKYLYQNVKGGQNVKKMESNTNVEDFTKDDFTQEDKVEGGNFHNFDNEPIIIGVLDHIEDSQYGKNLFLKITKDKMAVVGDYTALRGKVGVEDIGKKIKIAYIGEQKSSTGRMYKAFEVFKREIK